MGQLLALLRSSDPPSAPLATVNLIDPAVSALEQELLNAVTAILQRSPAVLAGLKEYHGCDQAIRAAISTPNTQTETEAWNAVVPCVVRLREYYEYATQIEQILPQILAKFCAPTNGGVNVQANLEANQATAKAFADLLSFSWEFDEVKMGKPAIQNDFSYYRRTVSRTRSNPAAPTAATLPVPDELANRMSLFYAYPSPFLKLMTDTVAAYVTQHSLADAVAASLLLIATVCQNAVNTQSSVPALFALRVMTGCLVMYDFIHPVGLFPKASEVNMRVFVRTIQTHGGSASETLLNSLRYSTKTFNSQDVPKATKALLDPHAA
ncbi:hypothetical protein H9P43_005592 [Blastocladiella emersonii ATCC 22665]|nr:hypothetical protein H9P43_005592 [Blastocladiella emersonii ATCC 22665]